MKPRIEVAPESYVLFGLMVFLLPLRWWLAAMTAAFFHELCHYAAVAAFGGRVQKISVHFGGIRMDTTPLTSGQSAVASLAGPVGSLLLLLFFRKLPRLAICAFLQSAFNLLPLFPLDGGRAVQSLLEMRFSPPIAEKISHWIQNGTIAMLAVLCTFHFLRFGSRLLPLLLGIALFRWLRGRKTSCKDGNLRVQ